MIPAYSTLMDMSLQEMNSLLVSYLLVLWSLLSERQLHGESLQPTWPNHVVIFINIFLYFRQAPYDSSLFSDKKSLCEQVLDQSLPSRIRTS